MGRSADRLALIPPTGRKSCRSTSVEAFVSDLADWGLPTPQRSPSPIRRPRRRSLKAKALLGELGAIESSWTPHGGGTAAAQSAAAAATGSHGGRRRKRGRGRTAAEIAVVLTEPGLGGNDVDLGHRIDGLRRDRSGRARDEIAMARRWANVVEGTGHLRAGAPPAPPPTRRRKGEGSGKSRRWEWERKEFPARTRE